MLKIIHDRFTNDETDELINMFQLEQLHKATTYDEDGNEIVNESYRKCKRMIIHSNNIVDLLNEKLKDDIPETYEQLRFSHINNMIRFIKYDIGDFFDKHMDGCFIDENDNQSCLTILVYLNDDYQGGELEVYDMVDDNEISTLVIKPERNSVIILEQTIEHKCNIITNGTKYIIRADIMYSE